jgi:hypothetical protein
MKRKRLSAKENIIMVSVAGLKKSEFFCIMFRDNNGKEVHREKISRISAFSFQINSGEGLFTLEIQNDKTEKVYEEKFIVNRSTQTTHIDSNGDLIFPSVDFSRRTN